MSSYAFLCGYIRDVEARRERGALEKQPLGASGAGQAARGRLGGVGGALGALRIAGRPCH
jgi:hypothetical protein